MATNNISYKTVAVLLLLVIFAIPALGDTDVRPTVALNYQVEPVVLMPGDSGTITITLNNMATGEIYVREDDKTFDMNAYILSATLGGNTNIDILDSIYTNIGLLGPGDTLQLTFNIKAKEDIQNSVHFINFELVGGSDMYDLNYKIPVKVDDRDIKLIVSNLPSTVMNEIATITLDIVNIRANDVTSVIVKPVGDGVAFTPPEVFVGTITAGNRSTATFTLNTMASSQGAKNVSFLASYFNGDNLHQSTGVSSTINVVEKSALLLTAIDIEYIGTKYTITGDINNVGTTDAKNVMLSIVESDGVEPVQPYANYFIGTLEADDFSSFELSARVSSGDITSVPVIIEFRNTDNAYTSINESIDLDKNSMTGSSSSNGMSPIVIGSIVISAIAIIGIIGYSWKKRKESA
ncbi:MAG: hypothetical protein ACT6FE_07560 [Methanosarcinaceae archaeon]